MMDIIQQSEAGGKITGSSSKLVFFVVKSHQQGIFPYTNVEEKMNFMNIQTDPNPSSNEVFNLKRSTDDQRRGVRAGTALGCCQFAIQG